MLINARTLDSIYTGVKTIFNKAFITTLSDFERVAMIVPSTTKTETYAWLGQSTRMGKWLGGRVIRNLKAHSYSIQNEDFESTIMIRRNDIEDDNIGVFGPLFAQLGQDAKAHPDELVFDLLGKGFEAACYDGRPFFDTSHPVGLDDGSALPVSNMQEGTDTPWFLLDTTKAVKPLIFQKRREYTLERMDKGNTENVFMRAEYYYGVDCRVNVGFALWQLAYASKKPLTIENYAAARAAMRSFRADNGRPLNVQPSLLVVPVELERQALEIIKAERNAAGASNVYQGTAELLVTCWL